jgi:DNA polymerase V
MNLELYFPEQSNHAYPFFTIPINAGTARNVDQVLEWINLDEYVRSSDATTYYLRVSGNSMECEIYQGDLLVVERTEIAKNGDIVVAEINGEFTLKRFQREPKGLYLVPSNPAYKPRQIKSKDNFAVWGIVTHIVRRLNK